MIDILKDVIFSQSSWAQDVGLTIIRIGVGVIFIRHGYPKVVGGASEWLWLGQQMSNFGITFAPLFWGIAAAFTEFLGGLALTFGLGTRIAASFMVFTMVVAVIHHVAKGDSWGYISHPLVLMFVFAGLVVAGSGTYSLDYLWFGR